MLDGRQGALGAGWPHCRCIPWCTRAKHQTHQRPAHAPLFPCHTTHRTPHTAHRTQAYTHVSPMCGTLLCGAVPTGSAVLWQCMHAYGLCMLSSCMARVIRCHCARHTDCAGLAQWRLFNSAAHFLRTCLLPSTPCVHVPRSPGPGCRGDWRGAQQRHGHAHAHGWIKLACVPVTNQEVRAHGVWCVCVCVCVCVVAKRGCVRGCCC